MPLRGKIPGIRIRYNIPASISLFHPVSHDKNFNQVRYRTWFNPLSKFNIDKKKSSENKNIIIEEPSETFDKSHIEEQYSNDFKHYLKTNDIPNNLKKRILSAKLSDYVNSFPSSNLNAEAIALLNNVFLQLYKLNDRSVDERLLKLEDLILLFEKSSISLTPNAMKNFHLPEYMSILVQFFLKRDLKELPTKLLVYVVDLGSFIRNNDFKNTLRLLVQFTALTPKFTKELLDYYEEKKSLNLQLFEDILLVTNYVSKANILDDYFYEKFINYVEKLFDDKPPIPHEYKDLERNIDRIQLITNSKLIKQLELDKVSIGILLKLLRFTYELNSVNKSIETKKSVSKILNFLVSGHNELNFEMIRREVFKQDLGNESLIEVLLLISWSDRKHSKLAQMLVEFIKSDDIKFSKELRFQCLIYELIGKSKDISQIDLANRVISQVGQIVKNEDIDSSELYTKIIQASIITDVVPPNGHFIQYITNYFTKSFGIEPSVYSYKYRINKAVESENYVDAVNILEDSLKHFTPWSNEMNPAIHRTLNDLIVLLCNKIDDIDNIFPIFTKIKQQMVNSQCNIDAIKALSSKMLQVEYVGDVIEMLKRELPKIKKDDRIKLPIDKDFGTKYRELFDLLHNFVVTYDNEKTYETNWVLYGELHKYFHVPYESYLPAMKFFCEHDRLNASLIIFRQIRKLNELHGNHNHLPPSRDMYMYLFQVFGDKLYEEGVEEVHEHLKMDINLPKQDINLQNCILNAYSNLQEVGKAKDLFLSMLSSTKQHGGINEETIQIMIKSYTYSDMIYVQKFWNNLSQYGIIPNYLIYRQYLIAHVYHGLIEEALKLADEMKDYDLELTTDTLLTMYNYCLEKRHQLKLSEWAEEHHEEIWNEVVKSGLLRSAENYMPETNLIVGSK